MTYTKGYTHGKDSENSERQEVENRARGKGRESTNQIGNEFQKQHWTLIFFFFEKIKLIFWRFSNISFYRKEMLMNIPYYYMFQL